VAQTTPIHQALARRQLLPQQHLVDTGYVDAGELIRAQQAHGIDLLGPTPPDSSWQSQQRAALNATHFLVDWAARRVHCPAGRQSRQWMEATDRHGNPVVKVSFSPTDCRVCPQRAICTHGHKRTLTLRPAEEHRALQAARQRQATPEFTEQYATRAGVEGTLSQGVRAFGLRRARYAGLAKTTLQHALTATAINVVRLTDWLAGTRPERTRQSPFVRLMAQCA
jgi:transposase